ncbi:hypothetical protein Tco_0524184 [Tanacetum coccineum]
MSSSNQQTLAESGATDRPTILEKGELYRKVNLGDDLDKMIPEPIFKMTEANKKRYSNDVRVMNYLLQAIPNDIYNSVDACKDAQKMWERIRRLMYASKTKRAAKNHDPLALIVHSNAYSSQSHASPSYSHSSQPYYVTHPSSVVDYEEDYQRELQGDVREGQSHETGMMLLARAITYKFSTPTNNCLCTSINTRNQAVIHDGRVDIQTKNAGYGRNSNKNAWRQNRNEAANAENGQVQQNDESHCARDCPKPKVHDAKYFREFMLLKMKDEVIGTLIEEENDFMLDNAYGDETLKELTIALIMMAQIQPADDNAGTESKYDVEAVSKVNASHINLISSMISKGVHEDTNHEKLKTVINTFDDDQIDCNIIFDDPYVENNASKTKRAAKNHDPLALIVHSNAYSSQSHASPSYSHSSQPYYVTHPSSVVDYEEDYQRELQGDAQEDKLITAMMLLARAITYKFSTPTNNCLCTSINTRNQAVIHDGRVDIQTKNAGYGRNSNKNAWRQNRNEAANAENGQVQQNDESHCARDCPKPKVHDAKYFREFMLLKMKDEVIGTLIEEENDFMLDNAYGDETLKELTIALIMMAQIQPADDNAGTESKYDVEAVSKVNASHINLISSMISKGVHEHTNHEKLKTVINTFDDDQIDCNIIFDDPYVENNGGTFEHNSNAHDQFFYIKSLAYNVQIEAENQQRLNIELKKQKKLLQKELETQKNDCLMLEKEKISSDFKDIQANLLKRIKIIENDFKRSQAQSIDFELKLQHQKEKMACYNSWKSKMTKSSDENVLLKIQVESVVQEREYIKLEYQMLLNSIKAIDTCDDLEQ